MLSNFTHFLCKKPKANSQWPKAFYLQTIIMAFLLFWGNVIISQNTWNKRFGDINYTENETQAAEACYYIDYSEENIVILYTRRDTINYLLEIHFMELSKNGNVILNNNFPIQGQSVFMGFNNSGFKTQSGGFVNGGAIVPFNEIGGSYPALWRFTPTGDTLWMRRYFDATKFYSADNVVQTSDGGFALVGRTVADTTTGNPQIFVLRTDSIGEMLWYQEYGDPVISGEYGESIAQAPDGGFLIGGYIDPTSASYSNGYIVRIDSVGNFLWDQQFGSSQYEEGAAFVRALSDGNFIIVRGNGLFYIGNDSQSISQIIKINPEGDILWQGSYGQISENSFFLTAKENPDATIIAQGVTITENPTNQAFGLVGTLAKFSADGDSLWMREYSYQTEGTPEAYVIHTLRDVTPLPDGGYAAAGWVNVLNIPDNPGEYFGQDVWVFKTDSMGCIVAGCDTIVGIEELLFAEQQTWFTYGPNPVKTRLNIYLTEINPGIINDLTFELRNLEGKLIRQFYASEFGGISYMLDIDNQPGGMYILSLRNGNRILQSERIIIVE